MQGIMSPQTGGKAGAIYSSEHPASCYDTIDDYIIEDLIFYYG